jgi:hypothetical protein
MNADHMHQLYGGDLSDHYIQSKPINYSKVSLGHDDPGALESIYNNSVRSKGAIDTTGLASPNLNLNGLIEQRPPDPMQTMLNNTLTKIAQDLGLEGDPAVNPVNIQSILTPKNPTQDDIHQAQDSVAAALEELKRLGAL